MSDRVRGREVLEARIRGRAQRPIVRRHVFGYLAGSTEVLAIAVGFLMTIIDDRDSRRSAMASRGRW